MPRTAREAAAARPPQTLLTLPPHPTCACAAAATACPRCAPWPHLRFPVHRLILFCLPSPPHVRVRGHLRFGSVPDCTLLVGTPRVRSILGMDALRKRRGGMMTCLLPRSDTLQRLCLLRRRSCCAALRFCIAEVDFLGRSAPLPLLPCSQPECVLRFGCVACCARQGVSHAADPLASRGDLWRGRLRHPSSDPPTLRPTYPLTTHPYPPLPTHPAVEIIRVWLMLYPRENVLFIPYEASRQLLTRPACVAAPAVFGFLPQPRRSARLQRRCSLRRARALMRVRR